MKLKREIQTALLGLALFVVSSCGKKDSTPAPPPPTALEITVTNDLGTKVAGATVKLFGSQSDWSYGINELDAKVTDANGKATFTNLSTKKYYWSARKECENNQRGANTTPSVISPNQTTSVTTVLGKTGTLRFTNTSSNPYDVFANGVLLGTIQGNSTVNFSSEPAGAYTVRVLQKSGYAVYPTDKSYTGTLTCGGTLLCTFP